MVKKIFTKLFGAVACLFSLTFVIYFFNLDMKLLSLVEPLLLNHYDNMPRKQSL